MKTIKISYDVIAYYCPTCKALYFSEVDCRCLNALDITEDVEDVKEEDE